MSALGTLSRRAFLISSAAVAGGVAFGAYLYRKPHANPLMDSAQAGEAVFNPWVKVDAEGVTVIAPHADIGQGVRSVQAALVAEELDIPLEQLKVEPGAPSPAYYNTAMAGEGAPFLSNDHSLVAEIAREALGAMGKIIGLQGTGGSTTVPDSYIKLRHAGAVARETLKAAAAQQTGVAVNELYTESGTVVLPDGTRMPYAELATRAATIQPVQVVTLRDPARWWLLGKPMQRIDVVDKSTGTLDYGIDQKADDMVYAAVRINPYQGGPLNGFDASKAETMRGVHKVLPVQGGVAIVADNTWRAFKALDAVEYDWGSGPYPPNQADHWAGVEAAFDDEPERIWRDVGDSAAALGNAGEGLVEAEYRAPYLAHQPLEPLGATIRLGADRVDLWVASQMPRQCEQFVAEITGLDVEQTYLHNLYSGGSFGHRLEFEHIRQAAQIAVQMPEQTIKLTYSREEDFAHDFPRQIAMARGRGVVRDGAVDTLDLAIAAPSVMASQMGRVGISLPGPDAQLPAGAWNLLYGMPNLRVAAHRAAPLAPISSWRSVGASHAGFFYDSFLDELLHAAGKDPLYGRMELLTEPHDRAVLEAVAEMSAWDSGAPEGRARGVAYVESFGVPVAEVIEVSQDDRGRIRIHDVWVACEVGQVIDPVNFENQVQGGVVWGLGHAINCEITYADGKVQQTNYHAFEGMRMYQCPSIHVSGLENGDVVRGIGEPPVPPAAPALANAIFALTGQRIREMPFWNHIEFV